jgi:hypothetical protein
VTFSELLADVDCARATMRSIVVNRRAGMTPGDLFYNHAHHQCLLLLIQQELAKQQADQDRLAQSLTDSHSSNSRGPPRKKAAPKKCGSLEVLS